MSYEWIPILLKYVRKEIKLGEHEVEDLFGKIRNNIKELKIENEKRIDGVINGLKSGNEEYTKFIRGEPIDVVDESDNVKGKTEAGLAHLFRLRHRTSNAFVFSPDGKFVLQRRVHNKRFSLYLTIYGGHVIPPKDYKDAILEEIQEELKLSNPPKGEFIKYDKKEIMYKDYYDIPTDNNLEFRTLYLYELTEKEWKEVKAFRDTLLRNKAKKSPEDFASWIEKQQKDKSGYGEVWGVELFTLEDIKKASQGVKWIQETNCVANVYYLKIKSEYAGRTTNDIAYFTPDLLDRFLKSREVMKTLDKVIRKRYG